MPTFFLHIKLAIINCIHPPIRAMDWLSVSNSTLSAQYYFSVFQMAQIT